MRQISKILSQSAKSLRLKFENISYRRISWTDIIVSDFMDIRCCARSQCISQGSDFEKGPRYFVDGENKAVVLDSRGQ